MKKIFLLFSFIVFALTMYAQDDKKTIEFDKGFHFAGGVNAALPISDFSDVSSFGLCVEVLPEYRFSRRLAVVGSTGYTNFFGKDDFDDVGFIPVIVGLRGYILPHFWFEMGRGHINRRR